MHMCADGMDQAKTNDGDLPVIIIGAIAHGATKETSHGMVCIYLSCDPPYQRKLIQYLRCLGACSQQSRRNESFLPS
jgi:hypothetical protein